MKKIILVSSLVATVVFGAGFAFGQKQTSTSSIMKEFTTGSFESEMMAMGSGKYKSGNKKLANAYSKVVSDPEATRFVITGAISAFKRGTVVGSENPQLVAEATAEMAILQAAQNARVIELLEKLVAKR
jgi:phospholipase/lecithinase/hemolysin